MALPESELRSHMQTRSDGEFKARQPFYRDKFSDFHPSNALRAPLTMALACNALVEISAPWNLSKDSSRKNYWTRFSIISLNLFVSLRFGFHQCYRAGRMGFSISSIGKSNQAEKKNGFASTMRIGAVCRISISSANRCHCSRELRTHDLEGRPLCRPKNSGTDGGRPSHHYRIIGRILRRQQLRRANTRALRQQNEVSR